MIATKPQASFDVAASIWAAFESYARPTPLYYFRALAWHALRTTADRLAEPASAGLLYVCHQLELVAPEALTLFFPAGLPPPGYLRRTGRPIIADAVCGQRRQVGPLTVVATSTPYEVLVASAASLTDTELIVDIDDADLSTVSAIVDRNRAALESARNVLGPQCVVPLRCDQSFYSEHLVHISPLRNLARMFRAEAHLAARNNNHEAAASIGLNILDLANAIRRGGLVTDLLVGIAVSGIAMEALRKNRAHFNSAIRRRLIRELGRLESEREPFAEIVTRDRNWEAAVGYDNQPGDFTSCEMPDECSLSNEQRAVRELIRQAAQLPKSDVEKMHFDQDRQVLALMRLLAIELALRDWYESRGCFPEQLSSLAPRLLPELPLDPFTNAPFIYRRASKAGFDLYSTGPKMRDGGGIIGPWPFVAAGGADLYLDAADHWPECQQ